MSDVLLRRSRVRQRRIRRADLFLERRDVPLALGIGDRLGLNSVGHSAIERTTSRPCLTKRGVDDRDCPCLRHRHARVHYQHGEGATDGRVVERRPPMPLDPLEDVGSRRGDDVLAVVGLHEHSSRCRSQHARHLTYDKIRPRSVDEHKA